MTRLIPLSLLIWFLALVLRPNHAACPPQTWLDEGVRANGVYECAPLPPAQWRRGPRGGWVDQSRDAAWSVEGRGVLHRRPGRDHRRWQDRWVRGEALMRARLTRHAPLRRSAFLRHSSSLRPRGDTSYANRDRDWAFMAWVKGQSCMLSHTGQCHGPIEADHCGDRGLGQKAPDSTCVPLCSRHHRNRTDARGYFGGYTAEAMRAWRHWAVQRVQEAFARWQAGADLEEVSF